ncbi:hypothetical protein H4P12_03310 [Paracoccus sp. 11-3]|uniref:Uncharacterized protein n=1 Tax=Paracoccus amoyensis TaxID=2760093 RepID=A0A926GB24_9RHOB|nr:hypothetical protein [Paracoccus amoyensis]MBC9245760.1 hypothetical protein [Paracoccus amoyensis]
MKEFLLRVATVVVIFFLFYATLLSLMSNPSPKWFDFVSAFPILYICYSVMRGGTALERALDQQRGGMVRVISKITSRDKKD